MSADFRALDRDCDSLASKIKVEDTEILNFLNLTESHKAAYMKQYFVILRKVFYKQMLKTITGTKKKTGFFVMRKNTKKCKCFIVYLTFLAKVNQFF